MPKAKAKTKSKKSENRIEIIYQPIADLSEYPGNAREHPPPQIAALVRSIKANGFVQPVLVDAAGEIIAGHARVRAAAECGMVRIPTIRIEHLSKIQIRALRLADNRITELGFWNPEALAGELSGLQTAAADQFSGLELAFTEDDIRGLLDSAGGTDAPPDPPPPPKQKTIATCPACGHEFEQNPSNARKAPA